MHSLRARSKERGGFTIVELLIVIVVIGILAAITIVAYSGMQARGRKATLVSELTSAGKQLAMDKVTNERYPASAAAAASGTGLRFGQGINAQYSVDTNGNYYCLTAAQSGIIANISTAMPTAQLGSCVVGNRAPNPSFENDTSTVTAYSTTTFERSNKRAVDGDYSLKINSIGSGGDRFVLVSFPIDQGSWTVTANVYLESNAATDHGRGMWVNDDPAQNSVSVGYQATLNTWQTVSAPMTIIPGKTGIWVRFYVMPGSDIYIDNIRVVPA